MTDGQENTRRDYHEMTEQGLTNQTTLSTVSIGADADPKALEKMSAMGSGRFYNVLDANYGFRNFSERNCDDFTYLYSR